MSLRHPTLEWLASYAAGACGEAASAAIAAHLTLCPECRREVARLETVCGALLEAEPGHAPAPADGAAAAIAAATAVRPRSGHAQAPAPGGLHRIAPRPLADFIVEACGTADVERLPWRYYGPGVERAVIVPGAAFARARLLRSAPGARLARHDHASDEITYVLTGAYRDETGRYGPGDIQCLGEAAPHEPVVEPPDICIALVVSDAPPIPTSLIARIAQRILGR